MATKAEERNKIFKLIWSLNEQNPTLSLDVEIPITDFKTLCNVDVKRDGQQDFSVTVQVVENGNFRTFTKTALSFLEAFSIVNRICVYQEHKLLYLFDKLSEEEPGHLFCDNGPLSIHGFDALSNAGQWLEVL